MPQSWTQDQRNEAAKRARLHRPWLHSTGPRTAGGKKTSSRNAYKHGHYAHEKQVLRWYLRLCALRLKQLKSFDTLQKQKHSLYKETRNELTSKYYKWNDNPLRFPHKAFKKGSMFIQRTKPDRQ